MTPRVAPLDAIEGFLRQADLVKFAKTVPTAEDGELALVRAEHIVRETLPTAVPGAPGVPAALVAAAPGGSAVVEPVPAEPVDDEFAKWGPKSPGVEAKSTATEPAPSAADTKPLTDAKSLATETKPSGTETAPPATETKPSDPEAKP